jgi:hypothetical protein
MPQSLLTHSGRRFVGVALASLLAVAGCGSEQCVVKTTQYTASVNAIGYSGPTQGKPIARFDLTQDFVSHTPYEACAQGPLQDVGVVRLKVTNTYATPLAIEYDVQGIDTDSIPMWFQPGSIPRILPNETIDLGELVTTPTKLNLGARVILTSVTVLP